MRRAKLTNKAVTAAAVIAAISGLTLVGCRAFTQTRPVAGGARESIATAASATSANSGAIAGVEAVKVHTTIAQELVEQALPNSDPVGQAQLSAAGMEHQAVISSADKTAQSLDQLRRSFAQASQELAEAQRQVADAQEKPRKLEHEWYVVWGLPIEKVFWTAAITWLLVSIGSMALGIGNPISWIGGVRNLLTANRQRWIGNVLVK